MSYSDNRRINLTNRGGSQSRSVAGPGKYCRMCSRPLRFRSIGEATYAELYKTWPFKFYEVISSKSMFKNRLRKEMGICGCVIQYRKANVVKCIRCKLCAALVLVPCGSLMAWDYNNTHWLSLGLNRNTVGRARSTSGWGINLYSSVLHNLGKDFLFRADAEDARKDGFNWFYIDSHNRCPPKGAAKAGRWIVSDGACSPNAAYVVWK